MIREAKALVIECDHPDCDQEYFGYADDDEKAVKSDAQDNGWGFQDGQWCADHYDDESVAEALARKEPTT